MTRGTHDAGKKRLSTTVAALVTVTVGAVVIACGGRLSSDRANGEMPLATLDGSAPATSSGLTMDAGLDGANVGVAPEADSSFPATCARYSDIVDRESCETCVHAALARPSCGAVWTQLADQCQGPYLCVVDNCLCMSSCDAASRCSCAAGCLPTRAEDPCVQLWVQAMGCVADLCGANC
jgi:hypothetical protein